MKESKLSTTNKSGEKLVGIETIPSVKKDKYPTVILVHGFGVTKEEGGMFDEIAGHLAESGMLVYRFDFSGCGESEGDYSETSLTKLSSDLDIILKFVREQPKVDSSKLGILGQSMGTATTFTLAPQAACMIMMGSVAYLWKSLIRYFGDGYNPTGVSTRSRSSGRVTHIKPQFWKDSKNHNLLSSITKITCPILFIHGSEDTTVPLSDMEEYFKAANEPKEKIILEGADHSLRPLRDEMYKIVVQWFTKHLKEQSLKQ